MSTAAADSSIDVTSWFINRAHQDDWYLENEKIQNLLFLSQLHYAMQNEGELLMPSYFVVDRDGFREPNIEKLLKSGRDALGAIRLSDQVKAFLEKVWSVYGPMSLKQLRIMIKKQTNFPLDYPLETKNIVEINSLVENLKTQSKMEQTTKPKETNEKKVLISQNGPVVVSKWQPRKVQDKR